MPNSRAKGIRGELEVRDLFRANGYEAERGQQHAGGKDSPDVKHSMPGYHVEVKRVQALQLYPAMEQATRDANGNRVPVVFHKRNRKDWVVIMPHEEFFRLVKAATEVPSPISPGLLDVECEERVQQAVADCRDDC